MRKESSKHQQITYRLTHKIFLDGASPDSEFILICAGSTGSTVTLFIRGYIYLIQRDTNYHGTSLLPSVSDLADKFGLQVSCLANTTLYIQARHRKSGK